ncbi:retroviral-like aspartic protease family protein [Nannocystis pusilla]|uniref:Retroviral-like aspartic protease family protein n=1 Tax=Nannocystis pusilla TaxID=889268 RepID=A0ABS7THY7_9BACT|nr:retroviral-like aspartic protease family protein [Nannocystis pusilla]MBZ5707829.1 retroviral-like aspartic protease family protein [Nannocystis pusilla]
MDPRHGPAHPFTETAHSGFGVLVQPIVHVQLRADTSHDWSIQIAAIVDTGASITLIQRPYLGYVAGLDAGQLGPPVHFASATGTATCRAARVDLRIGLPPQPGELLLSQRTVYFTDASLPRPILLGQRGVLDALQLVHTNCGPHPSFRLNLR